MTSTRMGNSIRVGGFVARMRDGEIKNCSLTDSDDDPDLKGANGNDSYVGGLVGQQSGGSIIASYATGDADGGEGNTGYVGGLVGQQSDGSIIASYATGDANGGSGDFDYVGGLVGQQTGGRNYCKLRHWRCKWRGGDV